MINMRARTQRVSFIILQKALWENNKDEAHLAVIKQESVSVNLPSKGMRNYIYL